MRTLLMSTFLVLLSGMVTPLEAQDENVDPGHENHFFTPAPIETDQYKITFEQPHAQLGFIQVKITIENKMKDYLRVDPKAFTFHVNGKELHPGGKAFFILPKEDDAKRLKMSKEGENLHVREFSLDVSGLSRVPLEGKVHKAEPFKLPPATNEVEAGDYSCTLQDLEKETDITEATFSCKFMAKEESVGLIDHRKISVKTEDGEEFANKYSRGIGKLFNKDPRKIIQDGERFDLQMEFEIPAKVVDMQFATLFIQWNDVFVGSSPEPLKVQKVDFKLDERKTKEEN